MVQILPINTILKNKLKEISYISFVQILPINTILKNPFQQGTEGHRVQILPINTILKNFSSLFLFTVSFKSYQ